MLHARKDIEVSVQSLRRAARAAEIMIYTVERELPETAAALRLSSLELSDAIEEVSLLRYALFRPACPTDVLPAIAMTVMTS